MHPHLVHSACCADGIKESVLSPYLKGRVGTALLPGSTQVLEQGCLQPACPVGGLHQLTLLLWQVYNRLSKQLQPCTFGLCSDNITRNGSLISINRWLRMLECGAAKGHAPTHALLTCAAGPHTPLPAAI
jgi:hypothetical protein